MFNKIIGSIIVLSAIAGIILSIWSLFDSASEFSWYLMGLSLFAGIIGFFIFRHGLRD